MFTGLIEELGEITAVTDRPDGRRLRVRAPRVAAGLAPGASVAVSGVCLTVTSLSGPAEFEVTAVGETLRRTTLVSCRPGRRVNLERPLRALDRLDGHWVNGHVDARGRILEMSREGSDLSFRIGLPGGLGRFVVEKGCIAVDGVSLTVGRVDAGSFRVHIIPETRERTLFGTYRAGDEVNIEVDILAKYAAKALAGPAEARPGARAIPGALATPGGPAGAAMAADAGGSATEGAGAAGAWGPRARGILEAWERGIADESR